MRSPRQLRLRMTVRALVKRNSICLPAFRLPSAKKAMVSDWRSKQALPLAAACSITLAIIMPSRSASDGKFVPYATAGVGGARREIALDDNSQPAQLNSNLMETGPDHSQTVFTGNFGGGLKYFFTKRFALRFDLRDQVGNFKGTFSNVAGVPGGIVRASRTLNDIQITGGIVFRFGKS